MNLRLKEYTYQETKLLLFFTLHHTGDPGLGDSDRRHLSRRAFSSYTAPLGEVVGLL